MLFPGASFFMPVMFSSMLAGLGLDLDSEPEEVFRTTSATLESIDPGFDIPLAPMFELAEQRAEQLTTLLFQAMPSIHLMRGPPPAAKKSVRTLKTTRVTAAMRKLQDGCVRSFVLCVLRSVRHVLLL